jgi:hypothetical protein
MKYTIALLLVAAVQVQAGGCFDKYLEDRLDDIEEQNNRIEEQTRSASLQFTAYISDESDTR